MNLGLKPSSQISLSLLSRLKTDPVTREGLGLGYVDCRLNHRTKRRFCAKTVMCQELCMETCPLRHVIANQVFQLVNEGQNVYVLV